jgi:hypothetical protein
MSNTGVGKEAVAVATLGVKVVTDPTAGSGTEAVATATAASIVGLILRTGAGKEAVAVATVGSNVITGTIDGIDAVAVATAASMVGLNVRSGVGTEAVAVATAAGISISIVGVGNEAVAVATAAAITGLVGGDTHALRAMGRNRLALRRGYAIAYPSSRTYRVPERSSESTGAEVNLTTSIVSACVTPHSQPSGNHKASPTAMLNALA